MNIKIITEPISRDELCEIAAEFYEDMIKGAVDVEKEIMAVGGEWHMDSNLKLQRETGSKRQDIWGINIFLNRPKDERLEYNSLINIRAEQGNRSLEIQSQELRDRIKAIVDRFVL